MKSEKVNFGMRKVLIFTVLFAALAFAIVSIGCASADLNEGLVAHYPFNGNANDDSGNGNHGTVDGATLTTDRFGNQDSAYEFDGKDSRIKLNKNAMDGLDTFTVGLWVKTSDGGYKKTFISASNSDFSQVFLFRHDYGSINVDVSPQNQYATHRMSDTKINDGSWHYLALTRSGSMVKLYIDGEFDSVWDHPVPVGKLDIDPSGLWLGGEQDCVGGCWDPNQQYKGSMDDIRIYNRALSETEIKELYNLYDDGDVVTPKKGLVGYWNFDEGSGNTARDSSGNGNDGTIQGAIRVDNGGCGKALSFDGREDSVQIPHTVINKLLDITFSAWIKTDADEVGIFSGANSDCADELYTYIRKGKLLIASKCGGFSGEGTINDGSWHHISVVREGSSGIVKIFIDGQLDNTKSLPTGNLIIDPDGLWIGREQDCVGGCWAGGSQDFKGIIDEVRIYNYALTQSEIQGDMDACRPGDTLVKKPDLTPYELTWTPLSPTTSDNITISWRVKNQGDADAVGKFYTELYVDDERKKFWENDSLGVGQETSGSMNIGKLSAREYPVTVKTDATGAISESNEGNNECSKTLTVVTSASDTVSYRGHSYLVVTAEKTWHDAKSYAELLGGHLVTISDEAENTFVTDLARAKGVSRDFWIGLTDEEEEGNFVWVTGEPLDFTFWPTGEPNDYGSGEDYVSIGWATFGGYWWNDMPKRHSKPFVVEFEGTPKKGLVGYWNFDEGSGTTAYDSSGYGNHGTVQGATWVDNGRCRKALSFDGNEDSVQIPHTVINNLLDITFSAWIKTSVGNAGILTGANSGDPDEFLIYITSGGKLKPHVKNHTLHSERIINDGLWHYISVVREGSSGIVQIFIDGQLDNTKSLATGNLIIDPDGLWIGREQDCVGGCWAGGSQDFKGTIDEVRIYNYARSPSEILEDLKCSPSTPMKPLLCTEPDSLTHDFGSVPEDQTKKWRFDIKNGGAGKLTWTVSADRDWITVSPASGSTKTETDTVTVSIDTTGLERGKKYTGPITVSSDDGETKQGTITVYVLEPGEEYITITNWGSEGTDDREFYYPRGIAVVNSNNVYVADTDNNRTQKFDSGGKYITKWGKYGTRDREFNRPYDVAVDSGGNVYVVDAYNHRIQKFNSDGNFIIKWGKYGAANGEFRFPVGIAVDSRDNVYVTDADNHRIQKFNSNGKYITKWGKEGTSDGEFYYPQGIAVDSSDNVYVTDSHLHQIQKFDSNGKYLTKWGKKGTRDGEFSSPWDIAVDSSDNVYVADTHNHRIQKFDSQGTFITKWGSQGTDDGEFYFPEGIAVDSSGNVYVADTFNQRIQKFAPDIPGDFPTLYYPIIYDNNWNADTWGYTDTTTWTIDKHTLYYSNTLDRVLVKQIVIWYEWDSGEESVSYVIEKDGVEFQKGEFIKGGCLSSNSQWCYGRDTLRCHTDMFFPAGTYVLKLTKSKMAQNSGSNGDGFVKLLGPITPKTADLFYDNWNPYGCGKTDTSTWTHDKSVFIEEIWIHYNGDPDETVSYVIKKDGVEFHKGNFVMGPSTYPGWYRGTDTLDKVFPAGTYVMTLSKAKQCQNSHSNGNGYVRLFGVFPASYYPIIYDNNWNTDTWGYTDTTTWTINKDTLYYSNTLDRVLVKQIVIWYEWDPGEESVSYVIEKDGVEFQKGAFIKGECLSSNSPWCYGRDTLRCHTDMFFPAGTYVLKLTKSKMAQNSGSNGDGFVKLLGPLNPKTADLFYDNWNPHGCGKTDTSTWTLDKSVFIEEIWIHYNGDPDETVSYVIKKDGVEFQKGNLVMGPSTYPGWYRGTDTFDKVFPAGTYVMTLSKAKQCQNPQSNGNGYVRLFSSAVSAGEAYLWLSDFTRDKIYKLDTSGNVLTSFDSPGKVSSDLAWDGTYLWNLDKADGKIYKLDTSGNVIDSINAPGYINQYSASGGLAWDGTYLWCTDDGFEAEGKMFKLDTSGNVVTSFNAPQANVPQVPTGYYPGGLAWDGRYLWYVRDYTNAELDNEIYQLDTTGNVISHFTAPSFGSGGLTWDGSIRVRLSLF